MRLGTRQAVPRSVDLCMHTDTDVYACRPFQPQACSGARCDTDVFLLALVLRPFQNVHTVAGVLKRALMKLEPCLVPEKTFDQLLATLPLPPLEVLPRDLGLCA